MDHYETLGVPRDASPADIKKAFRRKASTAHPDKGGSSSDMAAVNRAHDTLADPVKRLRYDQHGDRPELSDDDQARKLLAEIFGKLLDLDDVCIVAKTRDVLTDLGVKIQHQRKADTARRARLMQRRDKVTCSGALNLLHILIDKQVADIDAAELSHAEVLKAQAKALELLDDYTSTEAPPDSDQLFHMMFGSTAATSAMHRSATRRARA